LRIVDLSDAFRTFDPGCDVPDHCDGQRHRIVARYLDEYTRRESLDDPARVRALPETER
jgi:hypothetical protein